MSLEIVFYSTIYIIGILLGSFFTLATYRIPKKQDIIYTRSYCPNCNHRLNFIDLIPVLSFLILRGKCRYCKDKISPRYIIIELLSGAIYTLIVYGLKIDIYNINFYNSLVMFLVTIIYSIIAIILGIRIEKWITKK